MSHMEQSIAKIYTACGFWKEYQLRAIELGKVINEALYYAFVQDCIQIHTNGITREVALRDIMYI